MSQKQNTWVLYTGLRSDVKVFTNLTKVYCYLRADLRNCPLDLNSLSSLRQRVGPAKWYIWRSPHSDLECQLYRVEVNP